MPEFEPGNQYGLATRFAAGASGNPEGRPPGPSRGTVLRQLLALKASYTAPDGSRIEGDVEGMIGMAMVAAASMGDVNAFKAIMDDVYGKLTDKSEITLPAKTIIKIGGKRPAQSDAAEPASN